MQTCSPFPLSHFQMLLGCLKLCILLLVFEEFHPQPLVSAYFFLLLTGFSSLAAHMRKNGNVNLLLFSMEGRGGSIRGCRGSTLWGDALAEELSRWREAIFASRVLCQARAAPRLPPLPLYC